MFPSKGTPDYKAAAKILLPLFIEFLEKNPQDAGDDNEQVVNKSPDPHSDQDTSTTKP